MALQSEHIRHVPSFLGTKMIGIAQGLMLSWMRIYDLKREGGELFKGGFRKKFKLEQNPLYETQSEIQLAKI